MSACGIADSPVLDPQGPVGLTQRELLFIGTGLMLLVLVPVFFMAFWFVWRYRASNPTGRYAPEWSYSAWLDAVVWLVPAVIVATLGYLVWTYTHKLDPYDQVGAGKPLEVQAVAQDWKWLFIYPEQDIAVVNELVFPSDRPLKLVLTSDTVMNAIYIPGLGSQIFAMAGMRTELNLKADGPGEFRGRNMQYNGRGFPEQHFAVRATTPDGFDAWIDRARKATQRLDSARYEALAKPSGDVPVTYFSDVEPGLFAAIIAKFAGPQAGAHGTGSR